uniref:Uncharacterized protein n=1 Tax=Triticum urartu TaxID=4572 RepID=A0A8R7TZM3_TRIUA
MGRIRTARDGARHQSLAQPPIPPPPNHSYGLAAPSRASHTHSHHSLVSGEIRRAGLSRTGAQSGRRHPPRSAPCPPPPPPPPPTATRRSESSAGNARRPARAVQPKETLSKPCSPGWAEYEQEWIPWCTTTSTASLRHRALLPSLCIRMKLKQVQDG